MLLENLSAAVNYLLKSNHFSYKINCVRPAGLHVAWLGLSSLINAYRYYLILNSE